MTTEFTIQQAYWETDQEQLTEIRNTVFIQEQRVPADLEMDGHDNECLHVKAINSDGDVVGTGRLLPNNYIGRMCVLQKYRNMGIGGSMLNYFIDYARDNNIRKLMLNAQLSALSFYQNFGFIIDSDVFLEADIEHVHMTLSIADL